MTDQQTPCIAVVGNINADHVYTLQGALGPGLEIRAEDQGLRMGGSGANCASALVNAGNAVTLFGLIGRDERGRKLLAQLDDYAWDREHTVLWDGPTGHCVILIDQSGDRTILGLSRPATPAPFPDLDLARFDALYFAANREVDADTAARLACWDRPVVAQLRCAERLQRCTAVIASDKNLADAGHDDWWKVVADRGIVTQWLVVTLGSEGSWATDGTVQLRVPAKKATALADTTGAGDAYSAGFVHGLARDWPVGQCMALGAVWGADAVGQMASCCPVGHKPPMDFEPIAARILSGPR